MALALSPARVFAQAQADGPVMNALSAYMSAAGTRALPAETTEHAKYHLLDTLASMISGSELPPGQAAQRYIREHGGKGATHDIAVRQHVGNAGRHAQIVFQYDEIARLVAHQIRAAER